MCSCILLAGIFSPVMGDTRYSSGAGAGGNGFEARRTKPQFRNKWLGVLQEEIKVVFQLDLPLGS